MEKPGTRILQEEDIKLASRYYHPQTLNNLPLYQAKRKARYERRSRYNALVIMVAAVRRGGCHV
jgi:hypothetical protein